MQKIVVFLALLLWGTCADCSGKGDEVEMTTKAYPKHRLKPNTCIEDDGIPPKANEV
jgi:hypothetical protein